MSALDPRIEAVRAKYDLSRDDFWQIPQNKQWVVKHAALEIVATKANVEWSLPQIIEADTANGIAVMSVMGKMGDRVEWSAGEASPKNNKNAYPWAMAEKRAKDRVVLKLVGIHGLVYSEDEMPTDYKEAVTRSGQQQANQRGQEPSNDKEPPFMPEAAADRIHTSIDNTKSLSDLEDLYRHEKPVIEKIKQANSARHDVLMAAFGVKKAELTNQNKDAA